MTERLFFTPAACGLKTVGATAWVDLTDLAALLDDDAFAAARDAAKTAERGAHVARQRQLASYYVEQINMHANLCYNRSYNAIDALEREYPYATCLWAVVNGAYPGKLRAAFAKLLLHLHVDRYPHQPACGQSVLPQRVWVTEKLVPREDAFHHAPSRAETEPTRGTSALRAPRNANPRPLRSEKPRGKRVRFGQGRG